MNGYGNSVFLRTAWEVSGGVPPVNTVAPAITGTAQEGQIVTCSIGTWTGTPTITFAYQWKRNGSNIGSATNSTYTLVTADVSQSITCQVTATNGSGSASATSNTITPTAAFIGLLDTYSGATAAYSLRRLSTAYTSALIRVRRSSDNAEQDISYDSNNVLDETALTTFVGANSGFITKFYNQGTGSSLDFEMPTAISQPRIVNAGTIDKKNSKPSIYFDGSNDYMYIASSASSMSFLHKTGQKALFIAAQAGTSSNPNASYVFMSNNSLTSISTGYGLFYDDSSAVPRNNAMVSRVSTGVLDLFNSNNVNDNYYTPNQLNLLTNLLDNSNVNTFARNLLYYNGDALAATNTFANLPSTGNASQSFTLGRRDVNADFHLNGYVSEIIIYPSNQSTNRTGIRDNINTNYSIY